MAKDQEVDETAQPVEEVEEDFDGEDDLDDDLEIIDDEDDAEPEEEEAKPPKRKVSDADLTESNYEQAVRANPKRATAIKKTASLIETILHKATLDSDEGVLAAWEKLSEAVDTKSPKKYSLKDSFVANEVVKHPKFGIGFVNQVLSATKVEIVFKDGVKRMVCNKG